MRTMSVTSGKGGVGKSTFLANLAIQLRNSGHRVLIFDGDLGMSNVELILGVRSSFHLAHVLNGDKTLEEVKVAVMPGIDLISSGSGVYEYNHMNVFQRRALLDATEKLNSFYDYMLVDTAPGIGENVLYLNSAADEVVLIITPDVASFTDGYALLKILNQRYRCKRFHVVANMVQSKEAGFSLFRRFQEVVDKFLDVGLNYLGSLPFEQSLREERAENRLILKQPLHSPVRKSLFEIEQEVVQLSSHGEGSQSRGNFWSQVVGFA